MHLTYGQIQKKFRLINRIETRLMYSKKIGITEFDICGLIGIDPWNVSKIPQFVMSSNSFRYNMILDISSSGNFQWGRRLIPGRSRQNLISQVKVLSPTDFLIPEVDKSDHPISNQPRSIKIDDLPRFHVSIDLDKYMRIVDRIQKTLQVRTGSWVL